MQHQRQHSFALRHHLWNQGQRLGIEGKPLRVQHPVTQPACNHMPQLLVAEQTFVHHLLTQGAMNPDLAFFHLPLERLTQLVHPDDTAVNQRLAEVPGAMGPGVGILHQLPQLLRRPRLRIDGVRLVLNGFLGHGGRSSKVRYHCGMSHQKAIHS